VPRPLARGPVLANLRLRALLAFLGHHSTPSSFFGRAPAPAQLVFFERCGALLRGFPPPFSSCPSHALFSPSSVPFPSNPTTSGTMPLLHGALDIHIRCGRSIWDPSTRSARQRLAARLSGPAPPSPYVTVSVGPRRLAKTATVDDGVAPVWDSHTFAFVADEVTEIEFRVKGGGSSGGVLGVVGGGAPLALGRVGIPVARLLAEGTVAGEFALGGKRDALAGGAGASKVRGWITVSIAFSRCDYAAEERAGRPMDVPRCFFPLHTGPAAGTVRLYQDAHVHAGMLPTVVDGNGALVTVGRPAWVDLWAALDSASVVIYIAGWAVDAGLRLVREATPADGGGAGGAGLPSETLGELLKRKASSGVRVCVMVWDELASMTVAGVGVSGGLMGTGDEALVAYFRGSRVSAVGVSRRDDGTSGMFGGLAVGGLWTHVRWWGGARDGRGRIQCGGAVTVVVGSAESEGGGRLTLTGVVSLASRLAVSDVGLLACLISLLSWLCCCSS